MKFCQTKEHKPASNFFTENRCVVLSTYALLHKENKQKSKPEETFDRFEIRDENGTK